MPSNTSFSGINEQLDFQSTAPITINDVLVRALTGISQDIPPESPISFADLSGKYGVGPINGPTSNNQASYFTTNSSVDLQFLTDIYQANIVWSSNLISGDIVSFSSVKANASVLLKRTNIGNSAANVSVTADLYYGNTYIGSNTVYINLQATVYDSNLTFTSIPSGFVSSSNGYTAQTATLSVTAQSNVPGGTIVWSVSPNTAAVTINGNTVILTASSSKAGVNNTASYQISATVMLDGKPVAGAGGGVIANVAAYMYSSEFILNAPANVATSSNNGPLTVSVPFSVTGNSPGTVITWEANTISGSIATFTVASGNLSANLSLLVAANNSTYGAANSVVTVTANMYSDATLTNLLSSQSANVSLQGLVYGLNYTPPVSNTKTGYTAQTASTSASATYKAGLFDWSYSAISGTASITKSNGSAGGTGANISFLDSVANKTGSNTSSWTVAPTLTYGDITVVGPSTNVNLSATVQPYSLAVTGATSNAQYANSGPLTSNVTLTVSGSTPPGTNVVWTAVQVSGVNAAVSIASNKQSAILSISADANTFAFANSVYNLTANCYDTSSGWSLSSNTQSISLAIGTYGLSISSIPTSNAQSGYAAQTSSTFATASVKAGQFAWWYANTVGLAPTFSQSGTANSSTGTWKQTTIAAGTNTVTEVWQVAVYNPANTINPVFVSSGQTFSLTAQQNAYSFSLPSQTTNTQLLSSTASNLTITTTPSCNIAGYSLSGWQCSNTTSGYNFSSNSTAAVVGFATTLTSGASVAYYTTTISGSLLDNQGRLIQGFSYPVVLRSYFPNPVINFSNSAVYGYTAQTASGSYTLSLWPGATGLSVDVSNTGNAPTLTVGTQNTSYWAMNYSLNTGATYQELSSAITFQPTISFYDQSSTYSGWSVTATLVANNYNPAVVLTTTNGATSGWTGAQTAYGVITASCNANITNNYFRWNTYSVDSGSVTSAYMQGTGNNQYVIYNQESSVGTLSGTAHNLDCVLNIDGGDILHTGATPAVSVSATKYNPALVISGPTSNTQSAEFTSTASIVLTASANSSIPGVSYQVSASPVSGSASVSYGAGNTSCTLSVTGLHTTASATYNVTFSVLTNGTIIQTLTKQVSLSATGVIPNYSLTTPGNVSAAGFNFAQTCSSTVYLNGLTGSGDFATWVMNGVSGTIPAWNTPGGSNGYITTTQSCGSVGSVSGTIYQLCNIYDPSGNFIRTLQSGNYALTSTVYNPALGVSVANAAVSGSGSLTSTSTISLSSNATGGAYQLSIVKYSGATGTVTINSGNTGGSLKLTSSANATATYSYSASILLNGQTIAGPITGTMYSTVTITYTPVTATVSSTSASGSGSGLNLTGGVSTLPNTIATGHGGNGSYTYHWVMRNDAGGQIFAVSNSSYSTRFQDNAVEDGTTTGTAVCVVSDGTSSANTPIVSISLTWTSNK